MKTTSTQRVRKRANRLNELAKQHGYDSWSKLSTAALNGVVITINTESPVNKSNDE